MSEGAIIARVYPGWTERKNLSTRLDVDGRTLVASFELRHIVPREPLPKLRICTRHPKLVYFDDLRCPCCGMEAENDMLIAGLALAKGTGKP